MRSPRGFPGFRDAASTHRVAPSTLMVVQSTRPVVAALVALLVAGAIAATGAATASGATSATASTQGADQLLIRNATIVDGMGNLAYPGDVLVSDGRIVRIGEPGTLDIHDAEPGAEVRVVDLEGLVLAPGFIDIHNHSTARVFNDPLATTQIAQGVTTVIVGADGSSPWPIAGYLDRLDDSRTAINVGTLVGHGTVRGAVMGDDFRREAREPEIAAMIERVRQGMEEGAFGLSSGLEYDPGFYCSTEELIALARVASEYGGFYSTHMRDEEEGVLESIDEAIRIGNEGHLPVQISHIKMGNASVWGKSIDALERIRGARVRAVEVTADQYPYTAWQSSLYIVVRSRRFFDADEVAEGLAAMGGAERLQIVNYPPDTSVHGMRLSEIAARDGKSEVDMYMEMIRAGGAGVIGHTMDEGDVDGFIVSPFVMVASDGGVGSAHPRGAGSFARVLGHYVRDRGLLTLEEAIEKMTAMPAWRLGLEDRGRIRVGAIADLVAFDPDTIADRSTFAEPLIPATGVDRVWVAGQLVWSEDEATGARPGGALRRPERD